MHVILEWKVLELHILHGKLKSDCRSLANMIYYIVYRCFFKTRMVDDIEERATGRTSYG